MFSPGRGATTLPATRYLDRMVMTYGRFRNFIYQKGGIGFSETGQLPLP
jgi:hypothetical protein